MDKLSVFLAETYGANLSNAFEKAAIYNDEMDFLEYVSIDDVTISDRIDDFLTVMWSYDQTQIVGFRLKGFRCIYNQYINPVSKVKTDNFPLLARALEYTFTQIGNQIISGKESEENRQRAYVSAIRLASSDNVDLPPEFKDAA